MSGWALSPRALDDLDAILAYVERESGSAQVHDRLLAEFTRAFDLLAENRHIGSEREWLADSPYRCWPLRRYLLIYDPGPTPLRIIRILHGSGDLEALFSPDG